jgi:hypothetical protein
MLVQRKMLPFRPLVAKAPAPLAAASVQPDIRIVKQRRHHHTDTDWEDYNRQSFGSISRRTEGPMMSLKFLQDISPSKQGTTHLVTSIPLNVAKK